MVIRPGKWAASGHFCAAWTELFYGQDRGMIYNIFDQEKEALLDHLEICPCCEVKLKQVNLMASNIDYMRHLNRHDFAQFIRGLYKDAQAKLPSAMRIQIP